MTEVAANRSDFEQKVTQVHESNGHYAVRGFTFEAAANGTTTFDFSFPFIIDLLEAHCQPEVDHTGDFLSVWIAPDTVFGALGADASAEDTVITVNDVSNLQVGYHLRVGSEVDPLPRIVAIDLETNQVTLAYISTTGESAYGGLSQGYSAAGPTYCSISIPMVSKVPLAGGHDIVLGNSILNTSDLPANTTMRIKYTNIHTSEIHTVRFFIEYLY